MASLYGIPDSAVSVPVGIQRSLSGSSASATPIVTRMKRAPVQRPIMVVARMDMVGPPLIDTLQTGGNHTVFTELWHYSTIDSQPNVAVISDTSPLLYCAHSSS